MSPSVLFLSLSSMFIYLSDVCSDISDVLVCGWQRSLAAAEKMLVLNTARSEEKSRFWNLKNIAINMWMASNSELVNKKWWNTINLLKFTELNSYTIYCKGNVCFSKRLNIMYDSWRSAVVLLFHLKTSKKLEDKILDKILFLFTFFCISEHKKIISLVLLQCSDVRAPPMFCYSISFIPILQTMTCVRINPLAQ